MNYFILSVTLNIQKNSKQSNQQCGCKHGGVRLVVRLITQQTLVVSC